MTFNADIHNCVPGFVLFKRFAMPYGFQHVKWIRGENSYMLIGRTGEEGELIKLPSYSTDIVYDEDTIADIEGICGKLLGREVEWGEVLRDIHYNNIEPILNDEFFPSDYGSCSSLNELNLPFLKQKKLGISLMLEKYSAKTIMMKERKGLFVLQTCLRYNRRSFFVPPLFDVTDFRVFV